MIAPLFLLRALVERSWPRAGQAGVIIAASTVQFAIIVLHPEPARVYQASPGLLASVMYVKHILVPLLGAHSSAMALAVRDSVERGHWPVRVLVLVPVVFGALAIAVGTSRRPELKWGFAAGLIFALLSYFGAVASRPTDLLFWWVGGRYAFAPSVLFGLTLLGLACEARAAAYIARAAVTWIVVVGSLGYFTVVPSFARGPDWQHEVALWRHDPSHVLQFWPDSPEWRLLPPQPVRP